MSIKVENLTYIYDEGMPFEHRALDDVSFEIKDRDFVGLIGHTGSGKSTLIQHLNGLMKPSRGKIYINDFDITQKDQNLTDIRKRVGIVFQYAEYQLFEETVARDIAFVPVNLGLNELEVDRRVRKAMEDVGLDYDRFAEKSPFELSGGQKRRVAIAGVIAMLSDCIIFDEPTAMLDPQGRSDVMDIIQTLNKKYKKTVVHITHYMEEAALADRIIVLSKGKKAIEGSAREVFSKVKEMKELGLTVPQVTEIAYELEKDGYNFEKLPLNIEEFLELI